MQREHHFKGEIPSALTESIGHGKCILFVGSGLSAQCATNDGRRPPLWVGLLRGMVQWCLDNDVALQASAESLYKVIDQKRFLIAAQELQECLGKPHLEQCLKDLLLSDELHPSPVHQLIPAIKWASVLTSNYDTLLEGAYSLHNKGRTIPAYTRENTASALRDLRAKKCMVFKVHGDINRPESIILGQRDYGKVLYMDPGYRSFLENIFSSYTVLFVGMGADDPDLNGVIDRLSTVFEGGFDHHFMLVSSKVFTDLEARRLLTDKRIRLITYEADTDHSQVGAFLLDIQARADVLETERLAAVEHLRPAKTIPGAPVAANSAVSLTIRTDVARPLPYRREESRRKVFVFESGTIVEKSIMDRIRMAAGNLELELRYAKDALKETFDQNDVPIPDLETYSWEIHICDSVLLILSSDYSTTAIDEVLRAAVYQNKQIGLLRIGDVSVAGSITELSSLQLSADQGSTDAAALNAWLSRL